MMDLKICEQPTITDWLKEESKQLGTANLTGERLPSLKLESGKIIKFTIDFSKPFNVWSDGNVVKAIIPVEHKGEKKNLWLNKKNPLYHQLIDRGAIGQKVFSVSTVGSQKDTRYTIVDED